VIDLRQRVPDRLKKSDVELPINAINGNLIFGGGRVAAVYRVDTVSYEFLSLTEKQALHGNLALWMIKAEADFSVYRVCREYSAEAYARDAMNLLDERFADRGRWERTVARHVDHISDMHSFTPEVYFVVSLHPSSRLPWSRPSRDVGVLRDAEAQAFATLADHVACRRASTLELQWLLCRAAVRGVREPDVDPYWTPPALTLEGGVWSPGRADVQRFMPAVTEHRRAVLVEGEDGESQQTFFTVGKLPKVTEFPGNAELLFAPLERLDFPVDAVAHVRWVTNKKMLAVCDNSIKDARDELEDAASRFLSRRVRQRVQDVTNVQEYFESEPFPPGLETFISFAVSAGPEDREVLEERATRLKRAYRPLKLYRSFALQSDLFDEHMLRPDGATVRDYRRDYKRLMIAEQLAAAMPIGANAGGSDTGYHIGYTIPGRRAPVRYDPTEASRINRAGAVMLNGTLGGGKTMSVQLLAYHADGRGSIVVDIDPKKPVPDHSLERWPGMEGRVQEVFISSADAYRGQLDPLVFALPEMREELASSYMLGILPSAKDEWRTEIIDAVRSVLAQPEPCSWKVIELLLSSEDEHARAAGKALRVWADWGLGKCAFSRNGAQAASTNFPVTMIKAPALTLPMPGTARASYDQAERFGVETFKLVIAKAMSLLAGADRSVHKLLVIDEAHVLTATDDGRRFLQQVIRMGRYMNITVVLATQLAGDLAELEQLIGVRFVFRQETDEQARINLRALGLDGSDAKLIETLRNFSDGRCLMRGLDGRVVAMRFDLVDPAILKVASTRPEDSIAELEEAINA
jgi:hypothetical protein